VDLRSVMSGLSVFLVAAVSVSGQGLPGSVEVGVATGRLYGGTLAAGATRAFDEKTKVDDQILKGAWLATQLTPSWGLELAIRRSSTKLTSVASGIFSSRPALAAIDVATLEGLALRIYRRGSFHPYLGAGLGIANLDIDAADLSLRDSNRPSATVCGGARFYAARWVGFRFDVRGRGVYLGERWHNDDGWRDHGRWLVNAETQLGVFLSFGGGQ